MTASERARALFERSGWKKEFDGSCSCPAPHEVAKAIAAAVIVERNRCRRLVADRVRGADEQARIWAEAGNNTLSDYWVSVASHLCIARDGIK